MKTETLILDVILVTEKSVNTSLRKNLNILSNLLLEYKLHLFHETAF